MNAQQLIHWERVQRLTARQPVVRVEARRIDTPHGRHCICHRCRPEGWKR